MKSDFQQWIDELQSEADKENITIEAKYFDGLDYFFKTKDLDLLTPLERYKDLKSRFEAINFSENINN